MKDLRTKILIAVICILTAISLKLYLELNEYQNFKRTIPYYNPIFTEFALGIQLDSIEEYEQWISEMEIKEQWQRDISLDEKYQKYLWEWCQMLDLDYNLMLAIAYHESRFDIDAYSRTNDIGLMQVNAGNKAWVNDLAKRKIDLYDPYDNILAGLLIYKHYQDYWENQDIDQTQLTKYALNSYNMGIGGFVSAGYPVNRSYGIRIIETREEMER